MAERNFPYKMADLDIHLFPGFSKKQGVSVFWYDPSGKRAGEFLEEIRPFFEDVKIMEEKGGGFIFTRNVNDYESEKDFYHLDRLLRDIKKGQRGNIILNFNWPSFKDDGSSLSKLSCALGVTQGFFCGWLYITDWSIWYFVHLDEDCRLGKRGTYIFRGRGIYF